MPNGPSPKDERIAALSTDFVHLNVHSHHPGTIDAGSGSVSALLDRAQRLGHKSIALTNYASLAGALEFAVAAEQRGLTPIIGCSVYVADEIDQAHDKGRALTLIALNRRGYENLCLLTAEAWAEHFTHRPRVSDEMLERYKDGLVCLTGDYIAHSVSKHLKPGHPTMPDDLHEAAGRIAQLERIYGPGNVYLQLDMHGDTSELQLLRALLTLGERFDQMQPVITSAVDYALATDAPKHAAVSALRRREQHRPGYGIYHYTQHLRDWDEMITMAQRIQAPTDYILQAMHNTASVAARVNGFDLGIRLGPQYPVPRRFDSPRAFADHLIEEGIMLRAKQATARGESLDKNAVRAAAQSELEELCRDGYSESLQRLLWYREIAQIADEAGIARGPGRGSAPSSMLCFLFGITHVNPQSFDLSFARFIGADTYPVMIDMDFAHNRTKELIELIERRFAKAAEHPQAVVRIGQTTHLSPTAAAEVAAKWLGLKLLRVADGSASSMREYLLSRVNLREYLANHWGVDISEDTSMLRCVFHDENTPSMKIIPASHGLWERLFCFGCQADVDVVDLVMEQEHLDEELAFEWLVRTYNLEWVVRSYDRLLRSKLVDLSAGEEEGLALAEYLQASAYRSMSAVGAGSRIVLSDVPIASQLGVQTARQGSGQPQAVSTWSQRELEASQAFVMPVIGLKALSDMQKACERLGIDPWEIPIDDAETFKRLATGELAGVFGFESDQQREALKTVEASSIHDLMYLIAACRPGMEHRIADYAEAKRDKRQLLPAWDIHRRLKDTQGQMIFQEQMMHIVQDLADFTPRQADGLRKSLGKHLASHYQREQFIGQAADKGVVDKAAAEQIWDEYLLPMMTQSFCCAHAAGYARLAYVTAYLAVHADALTAV